ncbi:DEAD/DEAH box helicase [Micromonospora sediminicola]|uniref:DEAD/DEAH box helicase n=1 Tax=Micromonospora sediminicola TaxID=946078 RepID=UPI0033E2E3B8
MAEVAARLDLREPNRLAVETISAEISQFFDVDERQPPFEAVLDVATGVGKTYIMAATLELLVQAHGVTDFVIITPGSAILNKTKANFTAGSPKSLLEPLSFEPVLITADNFASPSMRAVMADPDRVKIYLFTVQSLLRPTSKQGRKVHKFQEGLGAEFYGHLRSVERLAVFADEHHAYYGKAFSAAVRDLNPWALLGLTATPHKQTPQDQIIYRYPLAAAIADKLVKTPVIVGRKDDRTDAITKLGDGITLLQAKQKAISAFADATGVPTVNPVMLVVAKSISDADEYGAILRSSEFFGGIFGDAVLVVHSDSPDEALEALAAVEDSDSTIRVIISVGMLKEGWDVKNVYVIASMRSSVSEILTEQTLGRGMRLPFGAYTDVEILDTLEVIAHERYEELLRKAGVLNEAFVDYRTRAVLRTNAEGNQVVVRETTETDAKPVIASTEPSPEGSMPAQQVHDDEPAPVVTTVDQRNEQAAKAAMKMKQVVAKSPRAPAVAIPLLRMSAVQSSFSLADITETDAFAKLGKSLAADPEGELSRTLLGARVVTGRDGIRRTQLVTVSAADRVRSKATLFPEDELRDRLTEMVLASASVPARKNQRAAFQPLLEAFMQGLGSSAQTVLSANLDRAGARLVALVESEQRRFMAKPSYQDVVEVKPFDPVRMTDRETSADRHSTFARSLAYEGWKRSMYDLVWFDSSTERAVANMVDDDNGVAWWVRLHINDLPILWSSAGQQYNPDLLVIEKGGTHWIVEVKMDKEMSTASVQAKREAAKRWANHVSADDSVGETWKYLLVSETEVKTAKRSWAALKQLGS